MVKLKDILYCLPQTKEKDKIYYYIWLRNNNIKHNQYSELNTFNYDTGKQDLSKYLDCLVIDILKSDSEYLYISLDYKG